MSLSNRFRFVFVFVSVSVLSSCSTMKAFFSRDLEEEGYTVGELYEDEYVNEVPYVPEVGPAPAAVVRGEGGLLYDAVAGWLGTPYLYGGTTKAGVDCSAFVGHIYKEVYGIQLHRVADDIRKDVTLIPRSELAEGDVLFFTNSKGRVSHVGIYLKDGLFAHASTSRGVIISRLDDKYWSAHFFKGGRRK